MTKKRLLIGIIIIVATAALTAGILYFVRLSTTPAPEQQVSKETTPDTSVDFGACDIVSIDAIKSSLGAIADTISEGFDTGRAYESNGNSGQNCVYGLSQPVTTISDETLKDSFYTTVYVYGTQASEDDAASIYESSSNTAVTGIGDKAVFMNLTDETLETTKYELRVSSGMRYFAFTLNQLSDDDALLDEDEALTALKELATSVDYSAFQTTQ